VNKREREPRKDAPPLPGEALTPSPLDAQPESGMVITESGIIIIDPNGDEAKPEGKVAAPAAAPAPGRKPAHPTNIPANAAWAVPDLKAASPVAAPPSSSDGDWDAILARARAQLPPPPPTAAGKPRK
jgi:hypothetical protein